MRAGIMTVGGDRFDAIDWRDTTPAFRRQLKGRGIPLDGYRTRRQRRRDARAERAERPLRFARVALPAKTPPSERKASRSAVEKLAGSIRKAARSRKFAGLTDYGRLVLALSGHREPRSYMRPRAIRHKFHFVRKAG